MEWLRFSIKKMRCMIGEMWLLIIKHKYYFLAPLMFILVGLALIVYYVGPAAITAFIYAGV